MSRHNLHKKTYQLFFGRNTPTGYVTDDAWKGEPEATKLVTVTTKYHEKVNDLCEAYINSFNQDAVALTVSEPMQYVTKQCEIA